MMFNTIIFDPLKGAILYSRNSEPKLPEGMNIYIELAIYYIKVYEAHLLKDDLNAMRTFE